MVFDDWHTIDSIKNDTCMSCWVMFEFVLLSNICSLFVYIIDTKKVMADSVSMKKNVHFYSCKFMVPLGPVLFGEINGNSLNIKCSLME